MDRRLLLEFLPGIAFLAGNAYGGLLWAASVTVIATLAAVILRWTWDSAIPWLAVSTLGLAIVLTGFGLALNDKTFVLVRPTVGAVALAAILAIGALVRPSLLQRTLGYRLQLRDEGWPVLHAAWISLTLISGAANEWARRALSADHWALYNVASDPILVGLIYLVTRAIAERYWREEPQP